MQLGSKLLRFSFSLILLAALSAIAMADTIRLKDGTTIKGHIASFNGGKFVIDIGQGSHRRQLTFAASEVESIVFDPPLTPEVTKTANLPASYNKPEPKPSPSITFEQQPSSSPKVVVTEKPVRPAVTPAVTTVGGGKLAPVKWNAKVRADNSTNGWTNSGWVVKKGQRIRITADGNVSLGKGQTSPPSGIELNDDQKLLKSVPTGALIAVIGDDNNDFMYIGAEREFTASRDGALFLGVNEGNLNDNAGMFDVTIEVVPGA